MNFNARLTEFTPKKYQITITKISSLDLKEIIIVYFLIQKRHILSISAHATNDHTPSPHVNHVAPLPITCHDMIRSAGDISRMQIGPTPRFDHMVIRPKLFKQNFNRMLIIYFKNSVKAFSRQYV